MAAGGPRYALDGFEVGAVSLKERKRAAARLKRRGPEPEPDRLVGVGRQRHVTAFRQPRRHLPLPGCGRP
ncbi:MAG: hypothetical protein IPI57_13815 [Candidatus Competibacteraceae bacterium]|nr:hypothetical protein [Candidatus Competibacteraceae bacterium]